MNSYHHNTFHFRYTVTLVDMNKLMKHNTLLVKFWCLQGSARSLNSKIPPAPVVKRIEEHNLPPPTRINQESIELLERLSLVDFANKKGIDRLEDAIRFADQIRIIDTTDVEPMITVLEDRSVYSLRYGNNVY